MNKDYTIIEFPHVEKRTVTSGNVISQFRYQQLHFYISNIWTNHFAYVGIKSIKGHKAMDV